MIDSIKKEDCTGCKVCGDTCPVGAVSFPVDSEGFWYPAVDYSKCHKCGLCIKTCPSLNKLQTVKDDPRVYAAWSLDMTRRRESTSGGLYSELAKGILRINGYIVGCVFTDDYKGAKHIIGNTEQDLEKTMRSKYFQSDTAGIYRNVKKLVEKKETVLFCGTPCQNAALSKFLGTDRDNVIQCDFICHGINSPKAYRRHIEELECRFKSAVQSVHFKNKRRGWRSLGIYIKFKNGKYYFANRNSSPWMNGYIVGSLFMRPSCYRCKYKNIPGVGDISIADFWGLAKRRRDMFYGISLVMVNSRKGAVLYNDIQSRIYSEPSTLEQAISGNWNILNSTPCDERRNDFFRRIDTEDFSKIVWDLTGLNRLRRLKNDIRFKLKMLLGR
ncbi:MAG: Coenzyme F420 hydrogenase/dehydrogenase, beta subunit C-terminal domain [Bacteroidales bacterium]|jgi:coenzyme F420-reducing hydrogenase beta subunit|nr:Coenzyme F420 hydrogenase/dehydrogenase, beta subunit C-terminal domain [Bacteroidales bacterium]